MVSDGMHYGPLLYAIAVRVRDFPARSVALSRSAASRGNSSHAYETLSTTSLASRQAPKKKW